MALERLTHEVEILVRDAIMDTYDALEGCAACAGIRDHPDGEEERDDGTKKFIAGAATKARTNHYGHPTKGKWAEPRVYITNATTDGEQGTHKKIPNADVPLRKIIMEVFKRSVGRAQRGEWDNRTSIGTNLAFGTTNSIKKVLTPIAEQMHENQMIALDNVTPRNEKSTLARKKKRSTKPLIDYGEMRAASTFWVDLGDKNAN